MPKWLHGLTKWFLIASLSLLFITVIVLGYWLKWGWTGLKGKTLWDWMQLLIIPAVLAIAGYIFTLTTSRNEHEIALDNQQEMVLQDYIDKVSELLLEKKLRVSEPGDEVRNIARVRRSFKEILGTIACNSWFAHFWTRFSHLWCSSGNDSSILKRGKNNCFTEKFPYPLKALKAFYVKTVVSL